MCQEEKLGCPQLCSEIRDPNKDTDAIRGKKFSIATAIY